MDWTDWKQVASSKPTQWDVPTFVEVTHAPEECAGLLGVYYHTPQCFNIDVYKKLDEDKYIYYYYTNDDDCGWRAAGREAANLKSCVDPNSKALGRRGSQYPLGCGGEGMGQTRWRGDGKHYTTACGDTPSWAMRFCYDADENCRLGVDWEHWDEVKDSLKPTMMTLPVSEAGVGDVRRGLEFLMAEIDFTHVEEIEVETPTTLAHFTYILQDARILKKRPSHGGGYDTADASAKEKKRLEVKMLSGVVATLEVLASQKVALIKEMLAIELDIPVFAQSLMIEGEVTELADEDTVSADTVFLMRKDPPMISTNDFLESLVHCTPDWSTVEFLPQWYRFDTYAKLPTNKDDLLQWLMTSDTMQRPMKHVPLTTASICECLDAWMAQNDKVGAHPEVFLKGVDRLVAFFEEYCFSPSLLQVYSDVYGHDDDLDFVFFFVAQLRCEPQTLLVNAIHLNCWC